MAFRYEFQPQTLSTVVGGVSAIDIPRLNLSSEKEVYDFILAYGYDLNDADHREQIWSIHRRAVGMIRDELLEDGEDVPPEVADPAKLGQIHNLLLLASSSSREQVRLQRWACALLRVMHVYVHLRHDLFSAFSEEIQTQILQPIQQAIHQDPVAGSVDLGKAADADQVSLYRFEIKPFKTTASSVIKLLARPERVALTLLDKLGVRFVTKSAFDSFRVIRFLVDQHIVSYPHIIPDQSNNTLFPLNLFLETMSELKAGQQSGHSFTQDELQTRLEQKLKEAEGRAEYLAKENQFSGEGHRFIKFINRKLIHVEVGANEARRAFRFFYPYEIQIMDIETYERNQRGPAAHDEYKRRQRRRARERVLGSEI